MALDPISTLSTGATAKSQGTTPAKEVGSGVVNIFDIEVLEDKIKDINSKKDETDSASEKKLDEVRTEQFGPKFEDLSKADRNALEKEIEKAKEAETYDSEDSVVKDPNNPGVSYQQVGEFIETDLTLYDGLTFEELPADEQEEILEYEQKTRRHRKFIPFKS